MDFAEWCAKTGLEFPSEAQRALGLSRSQVFRYRNGAKIPRPTQKLMRSIACFQENDITCAEVWPIK